MPRPGMTTRNELTDKNEGNGMLDQKAGLLKKQYWIRRASLFFLVLLPAYAHGDVALQRVFEDVSFQRPLAFVPAPGQFDVWYVVEQQGRVIRLEKQGVKLKSTVFVDISDRVESGPNEAGLLGMAFDPEFSGNKRV